MILQFNPEKHEYALGTKIIPSVTQIIKSAGLTDYSEAPENALENKRKIGQAVHRATELSDLGTLEKNSVHELIAPYLEQWEKFKSENKIEIISCEQKLFCQKYGYAGTIDRVIVFGGETAILDLKITAKKEPSHGIQLAAYEYLYRSITGRGKEYKRYSFYVSEDGIKPAEHTDKNDFQVFLSALSIYNFKKNNNIGGK